MKHLMILTLMAATLLVGCSENNSDIMGTDSPAIHTEIELEALRVSIGNQELMDLNPEEIAGLLFMREEEKLARDVYLTFFDQYDLNIFSNIAASEQVHTDAILMLLERYDIPDPVGDNPIGVFQNVELQALYDDLIAQGSQSLEDALYVGCAIEEIDIIDLEEYISFTSYKDLLLVYEPLLAGSGNHLRAYVRLWEQQTGEDYVPRFMTPEAFEAVINAGGTGGGGNGGGNGGGGNGDGGNGGGYRGGRN